MPLYCETNLWIQTVLGLDNEWNMECKSLQAVLQSPYVVL